MSWRWGELETAEFDAVLDVMNEIKDRCDACGAEQDDYPCQCQNDE